MNESLQETVVPPNSPESPVTPPVIETTTPPSVEVESTEIPPAPNIAQTSVETPIHSVAQNPQIIDFQQPSTSGPALTTEDNRDEIIIENQGRNPSSETSGFSFKRLFNWTRGE